MGPLHVNVRNNYSIMHEVPLGMAKRNLVRIPTAQSGPTVREPLVRSKEAQSIGTEVAR